MLYFLIRPCGLEKIPKNDKECNTLIKKQKQNEWETAKIKPQKGCHIAEAAKGDATKRDAKNLRMLKRSPGFRLVNSWVLVLKRE